MKSRIESIQNRIRRTNATIANRSQQSRHNPWEFYAPVWEEAAQAWEEGEILSFSKKNIKLLADRVCIIFDKEDGADFYSEYFNRFELLGYCTYRVRSGQEMLDVLVRHQEDNLGSNYLKYLVVLSHGHEKEGVVAAPAGHNTGLYSDEFISLNYKLDNYLDKDFTNYGYPDDMALISDFKTKISDGILNVKRIAYFFN